MTLSLEDKGFRIRGDEFDSFIQWNQVVQLRQTGGCLLFATHSTEQIHVPLRAIKTSEVSDTFHMRANELLQATCNPPEDMPLERIVYQLLPEDVLAYASLVEVRDGWRGLLPYALVLVALFAFGILGEELSDLQWWFGFSCSLGIAWLLTQSIWLLDRKLRIARFPLPKSNVDIQRWGNHLRITADGNTKCVAYTAVGKVVIARSHAFLMTTPVDVIIVPRRAFSSDADMVHFAQAVDKAAEESQP